MEKELDNLIEARNLLVEAYGKTIGMGPAHEMVWHAIEHLDGQKDPIITRMIREEEHA